MPTSGDLDAVCDTSVAVALLVADHAAHTSTVDSLGQRRVGLSGHAAFETVAVLTRLPATHRVSTTDALRLVEASFPETRHLGAAAARRLWRSLGELSVTSGAVYDALVGAAAREHQLPLVTRDRRALPTYRALGVDVELLP